MNQEDKELLLKDLCARLPYGVICEILFVKEELKADYIKYLQKDTTFQIKPYLRPMSSMTKEERMEFESLNWRVDELDFNNPWTPNGEIENVLKGINWLNAHHFDFCNLIERGLAIAVTEENNPYKE
jgi:hypothetical protein